MPQYKFSLYFVGYLPEGVSVADLPPLGSRHALASQLPGLIELTHNHGTEDQEGSVYHTGNNVNGANCGFGHIGITVPDVYAACARFKDLGVGFKKSPNSGGMKGLAFVLDPDGYAIEVVQQASPAKVAPMDCCGFSSEEGAAPGELQAAVQPPPYASAGITGGTCCDVSSYYTATAPEVTAKFIMQQVGKCELGLLELLRYLCSIPYALHYLNFHANFWALFQKEYASSIRLPLQIASFPFFSLLFAYILLCAFLFHRP
jgi:lactoylglutathione lyase